MVARRQFLRTALALVPLIACPGIVRASVSRLAAGPRRLAFYHTHTSETLDIVYSENGLYVPEALAEIRQLCRDFRTGDLHQIDPALLDLLHDVQQATGGTRCFEIISAYRSPATNRMLASHGTGVADHSLHLTGQAIDVRLKGVSTVNLRNAALARAGGGVGYYPESDFVHIDTGRVRHW
ncbi:MAG: YcbK family protein [Gammaproteobacteria bacterium]